MVEVYLRVAKGGMVVRECTATYSEVQNELIQSKSISD